MINTNKTTYKEYVASHYSSVWGSTPNVYDWDKRINPVTELATSILEYPPSSKRNMWTYATCGMSGEKHSSPIELHIFSSEKDLSLVELLSIVSFYHNNHAQLGLNHSVNFGKPWRKDSTCKYGLISLPYLDGPKLMDFEFNQIKGQCLWLIPITRNEFEFKIANGTEKLEELFDKPGFNYIDVNRKSLV